jgi:SAM-dependent methyltransferase
MARAEITAATRLLDLNTGGGETLLDVLQPQSVTLAAATESWEPNVPVARAKLGHRGIDVRAHEPGQRLPAADAEFDLVLNRHGACDLGEVRRVLAPRGVYLTQQVGRSNDLELNAALGGPPPRYSEDAVLDRDVELLRRHGFEILESGEAHIEHGFGDIGTVVFHLTMVSWQVPGFAVDTYDRALRQLDAQIRRDGFFTVRHHRYFVKAVRD